MNELVKGAGSIDMSNFAAWFNNYYQQNLGAYNTYVGVLSPQMLVDTLHIWGPLLTLFVFMFLGPGAGLAANGVGNRAATNGVGNRAWIAFSAAITIRQLILWFFNLPPIKALLRAIGIEIVPAGNRGRSSSGARTSFVGVEGDGIAMRTTGGNAVGVAPLGSVRHCEASKYESVANVPTAFSRCDTNFINALPRGQLKTFFFSHRVLVFALFVPFCTWRRLCFCFRPSEHTTFSRAQDAARTDPSGSHSTSSQPTGSE